MISTAIGIPAVYGRLLNMDKVPTLIEIGATETKCSLCGLVFAGNLANDKGKKRN